MIKHRINVTQKDHTEHAFAHFPALEPTTQRMKLCLIQQTQLQLSLLLLQRFVVNALHII